MKKLLGKIRVYYNDDCFDPDGQILSITNLNDLFGSVFNVENDKLISLFDGGKREILITPDFVYVGSLPIDELKNV